VTRSCPGPFGGEREALPPESAFDYRKSVHKSENKFNPRFLQINRYLNRPLASLIVRAVYRTKVTPNQLTYLSFVIGLAGAYFFFRGKQAFFAVGGILAQLSSIVDCADGMLARVRHEMSEFGAYLDLILDRLGEFFLVAGIVFGYFSYSGRVHLLVLGLMALSLYFLQIGIYYLTESYLGEGPPGRAAENRGVFLFMIFLFGVMNRLDIGIYALFLVSIGINFFLLFYFLRLKRR